MTFSGIKCTIQATVSQKTEITGIRYAVHVRKKEANPPVPKINLFIKRGIIMCFVVENCGMLTDVSLISFMFHVSLRVTEAALENNCMEFIDRF